MGDDEDNDDRFGALRAIADDMMSGAESKDDCQAIIRWAYREIRSLRLKIHDYETMGGQFRSE